MSIGLEKLFLQILNMSITGGYCILAVFALRWLFRKAPKRYTYLLWIVVALRLVCPFTFDSAFSIFNLNLVPEAVTVELPETAEGQGVTVQIGNMGDQYLNNGSEGQGQQSQAMPDASGQTGMNAGQSGQYVPGMSGQSGEGSEISNQSGGVYGENQSGAEKRYDAENQYNGEKLSGEDSSGQTGSGTADIRWTQAGSWIWIGGVIALAVLMSISWIRLRLHIRTAIRIRDNIYETEGIDSPFVMGNIHTKIYLPAGLTKEQQELILLHENCHVRRKDHLFKILASLLTIVYWFNPLVWAAWFGFCRDMEMSCDEMALKDADGEMRKAYSQTLLAVAVHKPFSWQMPPAFGENNIKSRIKHVLNLKKPAVWVGGAFAVILVAVLVIFGTDGRENVPDETLSESVSGESEQNSGEEESSDSGETEVSTDPAVKESDAETESSGQLSAEEKGTEIWSDVVMMEMPGAVEGLEDRVAIVLKSTFLCTACQSAGNEAENSSGAAEVTGAAEDSEEDGDREKNNGESVSQQDETAATESVKRMRYEKVPAELVAFRCVGEAPEDLSWQEAQLITSYAELETFRSEVSGIWVGTEGQKRMEQFRSLADSYHSGSFETKALIGVFVKQDNWDYEHKVKLVRDNELNLLEVTVTAERPEEEDYPQECFWLLLLEVDSAEIKDIKETVVAVKSEIDTDKIVVSSDVVTIPGGALDSSEPVIAESAAELQALGESAGVADTLEWKIMTRNYMESESRQEENLIIAVSAAVPVGLTEYDARVVVDEWTGELSVDVFYCQREDAVVFDAVESRLILIELKRSALENVKEIRRDSIAVTYNK